MKISVVIAAYNEAENIGPLTSRLLSTLSTMENTVWELIYVIEGTDETRATAETFASRHSEIRILYSEQPSGLANAFRRGFLNVAGDSDVVVTMDADLNHQPEEIPRLVEALVNRKADIVVGSRKVTGSSTQGTPFWKRTLSDSFNRSMRTLIGMPVADMTSGYRVYRATVAAQISFENTGFAFLPEILMRAHAAGYSIVEEPIQFIFRVAGDSKMRLLPTIVSYLKLLSTRVISLWALAAVLIIVAAFFVRFLLAYPAHKFHADADAVLAGLCGINVLQGHYPAFFPGGYRLGAQSCYATAGWFYLFGISRESLAITGIVFFTLFVLFMYRYLKEAFGKRASIIGLLFAAFPPFQVVVNTYVAWAYSEILMYCASSLWLAMLVVRQRTRNIYCFVLGLSAGLAFWCSAQTLMVTLPIFTWLLLRGVLTSGKKIALVLLGLFAGTLPIWIFISYHGVSPILSDASGSVHTIRTASQLLANASYLIFDLTPMLLANAQGSQLKSQTGAAVSIILYTAGVLILISLFIKSKSAVRQQSELLTQTVLLGLIALCCAGLFVFSAAGSTRGWTVRYILPLYLVVPGIAAVLWSSFKEDGRLFILLSITFLLGMNLREYPFEGSLLRRSLDDMLVTDKHLIQQLHKEDIQKVVGNYWDVYSLNFDSTGTITGIPVSAHEDYFAFGGHIQGSKSRWAIVDHSPDHLSAWERRLNLKGRTISFGENRLVFIPDTNPPQSASVFLDRARTSEDGAIPEIRQGDYLTSYSQDIKATVQAFDIKPRDIYTLKITVKNTGTQPWFGEGRTAQIDAGYRWVDTKGNILPIDGNRAALRRPVIQPGESDQLELRVTAPSIPGRYHLWVSMVQEGVAWFFAKGATPLVVQATVH